MQKLYEKIVINFLKVFMNPFDLVIQVNDHGDEVFSYRISRKSKYNSTIFSLQKKCRGIEEIIAEVKEVLSDCIRISNEKLSDPSLISAQNYNPENRLVEEINGALTKTMIDCIIADLTEKGVCDMSKRTQTPA